MLLGGHAQTDYLNLDGIEMKVLKTILKVDAHIKSLCKKADQKLSALFLE